MQFVFTFFVLDGKKLERINADLMMRFCDSNPCPDDTVWEKGECCVALYYGTGGWFRVQVIDVCASLLKKQILDLSFFVGAHSVFIFFYRFWRMLMTLNMW